MFTQETDETTQILMKMMRKEHVPVDFIVSIEHNRFGDVHIIYVKDKNQLMVAEYAYDEWDKVMISESPDIGMMLGEPFKTAWWRI